MGRVLGSNTKQRDILRQSSFDSVKQRIGGAGKEKSSDQPVKNYKKSDPFFISSFLSFGVRIFLLIFTVTPHLHVTVSFLRHPAIRPVTLARVLVWETRELRALSVLFPV